MVIGKMGSTRSMKVALALVALVLMWALGHAIYNFKVRQYEQYRQEHKECPCHRTRVATLFNCFASEPRMWTIGGNCCYKLRGWLTDTHGLVSGRLVSTNDE